MPVFLLPPEIVFPHPEHADPDGLLAVGGDLCEERLLAAYAQGIFPWFDDDASPIMWWSLDPRPIIEPAKIHLPKSLARVIMSGRFTVSFDTDFQAVISGCALARRSYANGTWITDAMIRAYVRLHHAGFAHSVECRLDGRLVGGLYGVSLGRAFFGESMFHLEPDASKTAFAHLAALLASWDFHFIDCQQPTPHVARFGSVNIPRSKYLERLAAALEYPAVIGPWGQTRGQGGCPVLLDPLALRGG